MEQPKRGRGRPKGSGKHDAPLFTMIASLMLDNPGISRWAATNRVVATSFPNIPPESIVRRLYRKWPTEGAAILAQIKAERARREQSSGGMPAGIVLWSHVAAAAKHGHLFSHFNTPEIRAALVNSGIMMPRVSISPAMVRAMEHAAKALRGVTLPRGMWLGIPR